MSTEPINASEVEMTPEEYIHNQVEKARVSLKRTKLVGTAVLLLLGGETAFVAGKFAYALQPKEAATIATGFVADQLDNHGDEIKASISERIPTMIRQSPDYVINALPGYRSALEDKVDQTLVQYTHATSQKLGDHIDDYIATHKSEIQTVLDSGNSEATVAALGPGIRSELACYLSEKPSGGGESINDQVNASLASLQDVQAKVHHLAAGDNLSPTEKQTRHALAVIASSVRKENLSPIPIREAVPQPTQLVASAE